MDEGLSVIVCTHNGRSRIIRTLACLQLQTGLQDISIEVLVVDNASTDGTSEEAAKSWKHASIPLRIIREDRLGVANARETGYREARHSLICWVDDDNSLCPDYLGQGIDLMSRYPSAGMCGGCGLLSSAGDAPPWFAAHAMAFGIGPQGEETEGPVPDQRGYIYGAGSFARRRALEELREAGFPALLTGRKGAELTAGEDTEVCYGLRLLGWQILQSRNLRFEHTIPPARLTWSYCENLFYGFGQAEVVFRIYQQFLAPPTMKRRLQRLFPRFDLKRKLGRAARADIRYAQAGGEGNPEALRRQQNRGRLDEIMRLEKSGELWRYLEAVQGFARRSQDRRIRRAHHLAKSGLTALPSLPC